MKTTLLTLFLLLALPALTATAEQARAQPQPTARTPRTIHGWTILVDDRLLPNHAGDTRTENVTLGETSLRFLEAKLFEITVVVPPQRLAQLQKVRIVLDLSCGDLQSMQYHPSADWLVANGYPATLEKCVHLPRAADVATKRNINEQPWVILHELAHAFHDQFLSFDHPEVMTAYERYQRSGQGDKTLLYDGSLVRHYGLTDQKEFFAEMTEAFFGSNDFYPFNRAELKQVDPQLEKLLSQIWE